MNTTLEPMSKEFIISRTFDAPRDLVWKASPNLHACRNGSARKAFPAACAVRSSSGGIYHYCLASPDGKEMWGKVIYREIEAPSRLVYINCFSDAAGSVTRHPLSASWPFANVDRLHLVRSRRPDDPHHRLASDRGVSFRGRDLQRSP